LPPGVTLTTVPDRSLDEMLVAGDLDAVLSARPPASFSAGDSRVTRLFPDPAAVEEEYARGPVSCRSCISSSCGVTWPTPTRGSRGT
jgi:DNA-binding transcriptional LysR family regulator